MKKIIRLVIYFILFALLIYCFIYLGKKDFGTGVTKITDAQKFSMEYPNISLNNKFVYVNSNEVLNLLQNGTGIIYVGFASNIWSQYYVNYLNDILENSNISKVYYYDLLKDRARHGKIYTKIETILDEYLLKDDSGSKSIYTPSLIFIKNGQIIYYDDESSLTRDGITPDEYWTENQIETFKNQINLYIEGSDFNE